MDAKLAEFRAKKLKEKQVSLVERLRPVSFTQAKADSSKNVLPDHVESSNLKSSLKSTDTEEQFAHGWFSYIQLGLKFLLWFCLWKFFIEVGFGAVYFIVSCSYLMYRNTRTGPRDINKLSAYSVFNPNHERLEGTFTAEQFEKELRHGAGAV